MLLELSVFIISIAFLLFALFSIPTLLQLRKAAEQITTTAQTLNQNLPAILRNLEDVTTHLNQSTLTVHQQIEGISHQVTRLRLTLGYFAELAQILSGSVKFPFLNSVSTLTAGIRGLRVFLNVLNEGRSSR